MDQRSHEQVEKGYFRLRTDGWTDPQNGDLWLLLSLILGVFFQYVYQVLCGCVRMSGATKRCLVATFSINLGAFFLYGYQFCVAAQLYQKQATDVVFSKNEQSIHKHMDTNDHNLCVFIFLKKLKRTWHVESYHEIVEIVVWSAT